MKKDINIPISQELIKKAFLLLDSSEDISLLLEDLLEKELAQRLGRDSLAEQSTQQSFPEISDNLPLKPQYSDLKHIDRREVISLLSSCDFLDESTIDKLPIELRALMESDILLSRWYPRENWQDLLNDYLDNGSHTTLDSWLDVRRSNDLEDEAAMWIELSRRSLEDE